MPYEIQWHKAPRILVSRFSGHITLEEVAQANRDTITLLQSGQPPVHLIVFVDEMLSGPIQVKTLVEHTTFLKEPQLGWMVQVSNNKMWSFLASIVSQLAFKRIRTAANLDQALVALHHLDTTLGERA
jgi:hypothetical protein